MTPVTLAPFQYSSWYDWIPTQHRNYSTHHLLPGCCPAIPQIFFLSLWLSPFAAIYWLLSHFSSFLGDLSFGSLILLQCISPDKIPGNFHIHICSPPNTLTPPCLSCSFQFLSQTSVVTSYCNSSLSYGRLTLQLRSLIIPVHFLQYSNSENDHTPLQSESIPSPSCPWSSTLL